MTNTRSSTEHPLVSLVVITYNSVDLLPRFFAALAETHYAAYEVIIVDNASTDGTPEQVLALHGQVRLVASSNNSGFGRACNRGAAVAHGELLVFMNPDVVVTPTWLDDLVASSRCCPDALICPTTLYPGQRHRPTVGMQAVAAIPGAAMLVPRQVWDTLGGFDEQFFLYWEDTELCWRAWLLGYHVLADLGTYVYHDRGGSAGKQRWDAERTKNSLRTYLKLMRWRRTVSFVLVLAAKTIVKLALQRDPALLGAWRWNFEHLGLTLAERRTILARQRGNPVLLERRITELERRLRKGR